LSDLEQTNGIPWHCRGGPHGAILHTRPWSLTASSVWSALQWTSVDKIQQRKKKASKASQATKAMAAVLARGAQSPHQQLLGMEPHPPPQQSSGYSAGDGPRRHLRPPNPGIAQAAVFGRALRDLCGSCLMLGSAPARLGPRAEVPALGTGPTGSAVETASRVPLGGHCLLQCSACDSIGRGNLRRCTETCRREHGHYGVCRCSQHTGAADAWDLAAQPVPP